jgi:hypothetical protein
MPRRRCLSCGRAFRPKPQVPDQSYCSDPACQRLRRRLWQRQKRLEDSAYRENESRAHRKWLERNKDYWRKYRREHPEYTERNRQQQRERNAVQRQRPEFANVNPRTSDSPFPTGTYRLIRVDGKVAKENAWIVRICSVSA